MWSTESIYHIILRSWYPLSYESVLFGMLKVEVLFPLLPFPALAPQLPNRTDPLATT
jgi:hypothetical protein